MTYEKHNAFRKLWGRSNDDSGDENQKWRKPGRRALLLAIVAAHGETCDGSGYSDCTWVNGIADHYGSAPMYN